MSRVGILFLSACIPTYRTTMCRRDKQLVVVWTSETTGSNIQGSGKNDFGIDSSVFGVSNYTRASPPWRWSKSVLSLGDERQLAKPCTPETSFIVKA